MRHTDVRDYKLYSFPLNIFQRIGSIRKYFHFGLWKQGSHNCLHAPALPYFVVYYHYFLFIFHNRLLCITKQPIIVIISHYVMMSTKERYQTKYLSPFQLYRIIEFIAKFVSLPAHNIITAQYISKSLSPC